MTGDHCEICGLEHGALGKRDRFGVWHPWPDVLAMPRIEQIALFGQMPPTPTTIVVRYGSFRSTSEYLLCIRCEVSLAKVKRCNRAGRAESAQSTDAMP